MSSKSTEFGGFVYLRRNEKFEPDGKQPFLKGFINISPELLESLQKTEQDKFGNYKLEAAVWKGDDPEVLRGKAQLPYARKEEEEKPQASKTRKSPSRKAVSDEVF
jgi:hypothetical protein